MELLTIICLSIILVNIFSKKEKDEDTDDEITLSIKSDTSKIEKTVKETRNNSHVKIGDVSDGEMEFNLSFPMKPEKLNELYDSLRKANQFRAIDGIKTMEIIFNNLCLAEECKDTDEGIKMIETAKRHFPQFKTIHSDLYEQHRINYLDLLLKCNLHVLDLYQEKYNNQTDPKERQNVKQKMENFLTSCMTESIFGYREYSKWEEKIEEMS